MHISWHLSPANLDHRGTVHPGDVERRLAIHRHDELVKPLVATRRVGYGLAQKPDHAPLVVLAFEHTRLARLPLEERCHDAVRKPEGLDLSLSFNDGKHDGMGWCRGPRFANCLTPIGAKRLSQRRSAVEDGPDIMNDIVHAVSHSGGAVLRLKHGCRSRRGRSTKVITLVGRAVGVHIPRVHVARRERHEQHDSSFFGFPY